MDERLAALQVWLREALGLAVASIVPASGDASFRRYFRVTVADGSYIAMDAPPHLEDCRPFVAIAAAMAGFGLHVPRVYAQDLAQGFLLLSDLGSRQYLSALNERTADRLYGDAIAALVRLQSRGPVSDGALPPFDEARLTMEMGLFRDWFLRRHLAIELTDDDLGVLEAVFQRLIDNALAQPRVWVHRDYHSRNLMVTAERNPGVLDFQDAVIGPVTYDLVSLLRDCYIDWPEAAVRRWIASYYRQASEAGCLEGVAAAQFRQWFDLMGVQRHLKAIGIFARLNHRDGKPGYLGDIPRALGYVRAVAANDQALAGLSRLIARLSQFNAR